MWSEGDSGEFIDYGRYFVPDREAQSDIISRLIPAMPDPFQVVELCCGEGQLAEAILERHWNLYRYPDPVDKPSPLFEQLT